jgi:photosystem II stability/assembly factor-like uncharacterized protein
MKLFFLILTASLVFGGGLSTAQTTMDVPENKPTKRARAYYEQRAYPFDKIPSGAIIKAREEQRQFYTSKKSGARILAQQPAWRQAGPLSVGGRTRSIVHHPTKDGLLYVGAAYGGVWKSADGGGKWEATMDFENSISMGALAIDHNNPDILYAATGEFVGGHYVYPGAGIFKSTDAGATWNLIGLTDVGGFSKIYVHPKNSQLIYAGAVFSNAGFYKSTDGGNTWRRTLATGSVSDISINPNDPNDVVIGVNGIGIYRSSDGGETWGEPKELPYATLGRVSVQMAPSDPKTVYALIDRGTDAGAVIRSTDNGATWEIVFSDPNIFGSNNQGGYDNMIAVHPTNPKLVIIGGVNLFRSSDGGANWEGINGVHADMHCCVFSPINPSTVYVGCDGGMNRSDDAGASFTPINTGLAVTQFHGNFAMDQTKPKVLYGGTQDNGTLSNSSSRYGELLGGDGGFTAIDNNPNIIYAETQQGGVMARIDLKNGGQTRINNGIPVEDVGAWAAPLVVDPATNTLFSGRSSLYASYNQGTKWDKISPPLKSLISMVAASQVNSDIIYVGSQRGELMVTTQGGGQETDAWTMINTNGLPNRYISDIEPSVNDEKVCFVTLSGFNSAHVFKTTDLGKTWKNIGKNLPDIPTNCLTIHPDDENILFVGTDIGVYGTYNGGESWFPLGTGFPNTSVVDIQFYTGNPATPNTVTLRVSTHGRSMWEIDVPNEVITTPEITAPIGGEQFRSGTTRHLSWYGFTPPVKLEYSINNGQNWSLIGDNITGDYLEWAVPTRNTQFARIRVTSLTNPTESVISRTFTIGEIKIGSILTSGTVSHVPYGIAYDGKNALWSTSFYESKLYRINATTLEVEREISLANTDDSLCTDITIDRETSTLYVHKIGFSSAASAGGFIYTMDTNGVITNKFDSPATVYPVGLELVDGNLLVGDRDGKRMLYTIDKVTGKKIREAKNPYQVTFGPRCICYDGKQNLYQTGYGTSQYLLKINKDDLTKEVARMELNANGNPINARGVEYDPRDKNFWVADAFSGIIYKVAGFETVVGVDEPPTNVTVGEALSASIYPNPTSGAAFISYELNRPASHMKVELTNLLGESLGTLFDNSVSGNDAHGILRLETADLANGVYSVIFTLDGTERIAQKVVIAH